MSCLPVPNICTCFTLMSRNPFSLRPTIINVCSKHQQRSQWTKMDELGLEKFLNERCYIKSQPNSIKRLWLFLLILKGFFFHGRSMWFSSSSIGAKPRATSVCVELMHNSESDEGYNILHLCACCFQLRVIENNLSWKKMCIFAHYTI